MLLLYVEGEFFETLELQDFPFDTQDLTFVLSFNVRANDTTAPLFLQITPGPGGGTTGIVAENGFYLDHQWEHENYKAKGGEKIAEREVLISVHNMGHANRLFQTVFCSVKVARRPEYYVTNVIVPAHIFAWIAALPVALSLDDIASRAEIVVGVLTAFQLFKYSVLSNMMPHVSYDTLLDKTVDHLTNIIKLIAVEQLIMALLLRLAADLNEPISTFDGWAFCNPEAQVYCSPLKMLDLLFGACVIFVFVPSSFIWFRVQRNLAMQRGSEIEMGGRKFVRGSLFSKQGRQTCRTRPAALGYGRSREDLRNGSSMGLLEGEGNAECSAVSAASAPPALPSMPSADGEEEQSMI